MNPRYQIFISSTFRDLRKERQAVLDAILELGHFPAGMEVFPAADATPWNVIETIIAESDYYVLIVGGVYGSTDEDGISYTEREYDLAVSRGIPVLAFLHSDPSKIPAGMSELNPVAQERLSAFRAKVEVHLCKYWSSADELKTQVVVGIVHAIRFGPRVGWIRGDTGDTAETLKKLTFALEENSTLEAALEELRESMAVRTDIGGELASGADTVAVHFGTGAHKDWQVIISWDELFKIGGPLMLSDTSESDVFYLLGRQLASLAATTRPNPEVAKKSAEGAQLDAGDFNKILYQFMALDFIEPVSVEWQTQSFGEPRTEHGTGFRLTKHGARTLARLRAIKRSS